MNFTQNTLGCYGLNTPYLLSFDFLDITQKQVLIRFTKSTGAGIDEMFPEIEQTREFWHNPEGSFG